MSVSSLARPARTTAAVKALRPGERVSPTVRFALFSSPFVLTVLGFCIWQVVVSLSSGAQKWVVGGWLINYSDGFIRRGLSGSLILEIARLSHLGPATLTYGFVFSLLAVWVLLFFSTIAAFRSPLLTGLVLLSPLVLLFNGPGNELLRKETLVFALIAWASLIRSTDSWAWRLPVVLAPLLILCHEAIFAWMPALVAIVIIRRPSLGLIAWLVCASVAALVACVVYRGDMAQARHICAAVTHFRQTHDFVYCSGAVAALGEHANRFMALRNLPRESEQAALCLGLYILPFVFFFSERLTLARHRVIVAATLLTTALLTLPLFLIAQDVGRWLRAILVCNVTVAAACRYHENRAGYGQPEFTRDRRWLHALLIYELLVMTLFVGVDNVNGPYFGFSHSLWERIFVYV